jgi:hypothetical protein
MSNDYASFCGKHGRYEDSFNCPLCERQLPAHRIVTDEKKTDSPGPNRHRGDGLAPPCRAEWVSDFWG